MAEEFDFTVTTRVHRETLERAIWKRIEEIKGQALSDENRRRAAEIFIGEVEHLVPMSGGDLRKSAHVGDSKYKGDYTVVYGNEDVKYAKAQYDGYNGRGVIREYTTEGTTDHWNQHMTRADRQAYYDKVAEEIK